MQKRRHLVGIGVALGSLLLEYGVKPVSDMLVQRLADRYFATGVRVMSDWINAIADFVPNSFLMGFAAGSLIFAYWDVIAPAFSRYVLRRVPAATDADAPAIRAWAGEISVRFSAADPSEARVFIRVLNWGKVPFGIVGISGRTAISHDNGNGARVKTTLPPPLLADEKDWANLAEPGQVLDISLIQPLPIGVTQLMPEMFASNERPYLELDDLCVALGPSQQEQVRLRLCDSLRMTTGEWAVRYDQTTRIFGSEDERLRFQNVMLNAAAALRPTR